MSASAAAIKPVFGVFIRHRREDQPVVDRIMRSLLFGGRVKAFTDRMLPSGVDWRNKLRRALDTAHVFIVIGSPASARSEFVLQELGGAWALGKPIVIVTPKGEIELAPPIEPSAYKRVALTELEQPAFAESLL
jgi:hypothetical protein